MTSKPKTPQKNKEKGKPDSDCESVKTQCTGNVSIQISDCEISHPNMPSPSLENLVPKDSPTKSNNKQGLSNPSFSIDTVSSDESLTGTGKSHFNYEPKPTTLYRKDYRRGSYNSDTLSTRKPTLTLLRRGSYTQGNNVNGGDGAGQLKVPHLSDLRKSNDNNGKENKFIGQLSPLPSGSLDNFSYSSNDGKFPPPSPGFYGNGRGFDLQPPPSPGLLSTNSAWSELSKLHSRRSSYGDFSMDSTNRTYGETMSNVSSSLSQYLHDLVRAFSSRTEKIKETTVQPPTPSSLSEYDAFSDANSAISNPDELQRQHRINSFIPGEFSQNEATETENNRYYMDWGCCRSRAPKCCKALRFPKILEPQSKLYMSWLALVTACFMYNAWAIPLRGVFPYQTKDNLSYWLAFDYFCDLIYLLDILVFKPRLTFLNSGMMETNIHLTRKNYWKKSMFKLDFLSLLPLDLFYIVVGVVPWLRIPRVLKIQTFWEFYERCDQAVRSAHILRIIKTMTYMLFLIHVETCGYYSMSVYEGIGSNRWVYNGKGIAYIRCFYLATKTATSIGNNPQPTNTLEYIFMTVYWVSGVFVFALLIGQIRDIAEAAGRVKSLYNKRMDAALWYVKSLNLPKETEDKVRTWFVYNWQQQKILDEKVLMDTLPKNLRTDLAIQVHFNTLSKVKLFQDCDKSLLLDLVLKLKPILYLPGDYVCRKGEVGKEMYIVSQGLVEVVGGPENSLVLATLKEGSVFGEISLLALGGEGNRRTADVRCKGFTNLFILSKDDFEAAMSEYPEAHKHMKKRAKKLLRQNAKLKKISEDNTTNSRVDEIIKHSIHSETPKMVKTVIQVLDPESQVGKKLRAKSHDSGTIQKDVRQMSLPHIKIKSENDTTEDSMSINKDEISPEKDDPKLQKERTTSAPTEQEVEDFFDEILAVEVIPSSDFDELQAEVLRHQLSWDEIPKKEIKVTSPSHDQKVKVTSPSHDEKVDEILAMEINQSSDFDELQAEVLKQQLAEGQGQGKKKKTSLKRDDTVQTEQSEDSADSGVQMYKPSSPSVSLIKSISNKDSKESFLTTETSDTYEDTGSWVAKHTRQLELSDTDRYLNKVFLDSLFSENQAGAKSPKVIVSSTNASSQGKVTSRNGSPKMKVTASGGSSKKVATVTSKVPPETKITGTKGSPKMEKSEGKLSTEVNGDKTKPSSQNEESTNKSSQENEGNDSNKDLQKMESKITDASKKEVTSNEKVPNEDKKESSTSEGAEADIPSNTNNRRNTPTIRKEKVETTERNGPDITKPQTLYIKPQENPEFVLSPNVYLAGNKRSRAQSIFSNDSSDFGVGEELLLNTVNSDAVKNGPLACNEQKGKEVKANGIPASNQITCSVEVHREKSISPSSIAEWLDGNLSQNNNLRKRKESVVSGPNDLKYFESSV